MPAAVRKFLPWFGPDDRVSPVKVVVFMALFVPGLWIAYKFNHGMLGPRALNQATHEIGQWVIRLLLLSLAVTPLRQILRWPNLTLVRRMIGVAAAAYVLIHLTLYISDENFNLPKVVSEIYLRIYLTIGFVALVGLMALAITSTDAMIARMGGRGWRRLHRTIYAIAVLGLIHFYMQSKADVWEPMWMAGLFTWLMAYRVLQWSRKRGGAPSLYWLVGLAVFAAVFTAVGEAIYYWALMGVDPSIVLGVNFMTMAGVRPSWIVLAVGLTIALLGASAAVWKKRPRKPAMAPLGAVAQAGRSPAN
jgi:sulfoxide reductase heme-binding subunit YedZ